jgi:hypothetical protein
VVDAILLDPLLNERHKRVLLDVYGSFVRENAPEDDAPAAAATKPPAKKAAQTVKKTAAAKKPAAPKTPAPKRSTH